MSRFWGRGPRSRAPREIWSDWMDANDAGDAVRAGELAAEMLAAAPDKFVAWFQAGLLSKALGNWSEAIARNERALSLITLEDIEEYDGQNPAAWNLGIAATALGDWATARRAWRAFGMTEFQEGDDPIDVDYGMSPVRLNPDRPSLTHQHVPHLGETEVVWCWRRSPAHAVIASVPLPESGHRFRDVVLHDGEPKGTRRLGDGEVAVFDELALLESSGLPTWQAQIAGASPDDLEALSQIVGPRGLGVDEWSGIRVMCSECSHGSPDADHSHDPPPFDVKRLGLAGSELDLGECLARWSSERPHLDVVDLEVLW